MTVSVPVAVSPSGFVMVTVWLPADTPTVVMFNTACVGVTDATPFTTTPPVTPAVRCLASPGTTAGRREERNRGPTGSA
jgi:hypothetical protein